MEAMDGTIITEDIITEAITTIEDITITGDTTTTEDTIITEGTITTIMEGTTTMEGITITVTGENTTKKKKKGNSPKTH